MPSPACGEDPLPVAQLGLERAQRPVGQLLVEVADGADGVRQPLAGRERGAALEVDEDEGQPGRVVAGRETGDQRAQELALAGAGGAADQAVRAVADQVDARSRRSRRRRPASRSGSRRPSSCGSPPASSRRGRAAAAAGPGRAAPRRGRPAPGRRSGPGRSAQRAGGLDVDPGEHDVVDGRSRSSGRVTVPCASASTPDDGGARGRAAAPRWRR